MKMLKEKYSEKMLQYYYMAPLAVSFKVILSFKVLIFIY